MGDGGWGLGGEGDATQHCKRHRAHSRDALAQLGHDAKVEDERRRQQTVLARVVHDKRVLAAHEDFAGVFVHGALAVADEGNVFDDDDVVGVLVLGQGQGVGGVQVGTRARM